MTQIGKPIRRWKEAPPVKEPKPEPVKQPEPVKTSWQ